VASIFLALLAKTCVYIHYTIAPDYFDLYHRHFLFHDRVSVFLFDDLCRCADVGIFQGV